jgi:hypothetical protein
MAVTRISQTLWEVLATEAPGADQGSYFWHSCEAVVTGLYDKKPPVLRRSKAGEAAFGHVTTLCEQVKELFTFVGHHTFGSIIGNVEGYQGRYPRCKVVEKTKNDPIGGSQWNTLGGNSANFIRPLMCRPACTLYSQGSGVGRGRMHRDDQGRTRATAID